MPRGRKRKSEIFNLENALNENNMLQENDDEQEKVSDVIQIDTLGLYGMRTYKYGYELVTRDRYSSDGEIQILNRRTGESRVVSHKKGDYTEWRLSAYPFHVTINTLIKRATQLMIKDGIEYNKDISKLPEILQEVENRILTPVRGA